MTRFTRAGAVLGALTLVASLALTGCGDKQKKPEFVGGASSDTSAAPDSSAPSAPGTPSAQSGPTLTLSPADGTNNRPVSTEISAKLPDGGKVSAVTLTADGGGAVEGKLRTDGSAWVPSAPLKYGTRYTASVTASAADGTSSQGTSSFTTMAKPKSTVGSGLYLFDDKSYGVAMPVVTEFHPGIPKKDRAAVQKRMFVRTDPPQPGRGTGSTTARRPTTGHPSTGSPAPPSRCGSRWLAYR